jgi:hypothetical protein
MTVKLEGKIALVTAGSPQFRSDASDTGTEEHGEKK